MWGPCKQHILFFEFSNPIYGQNLKRFEVPRSVNTTKRDQKRKVLAEKYCSFVKAFGLCFVLLCYAESVHMAKKEFF